jgi:hypothetical protein
MTLCEALLGDYLYSQKDGEYILAQNGWFEKTKMGEKVEFIANRVINVYTAFDKSEKIMAPGCVYVDRVGVKDVLHRYSRDIFGQKRLEYQIESLTHSNEARGKLIKENLAQFGCKTTSSDPYFYRKIGYLFYWFSVIKPFHLDLSKVDITQIKNKVKFYFNELAAYVLLWEVVKNFSENKIKYKITIHEDKELFQHFLYNLHYRDLSRSSLEFFLKQFIHEIK